MREGAAVQRFDAGNARCHHPACVVVNRARKTRRRSYLKRDDDDDDDDDALDRPDRAYRGTDDDERLEHVARSIGWYIVSEICIAKERSNVRAFFFLESLNFTISNTVRLQKVRIRVDGYNSHYSSSSSSSSHYSRGNYRDEPERL